MPILAAWILQIFEGLVVLFAKYVAMRIATAIAFSALIAAAWATCYIALKVVWSQLALHAPAFFVQPLMLVKPTNFDAILAAFITGRIAIAGYRWAKSEFTRMANASPVFKNIPGYLG